MVCGDKSGDAPFEQVCKKGAGQGWSLLWVCTCSQFVKDHQGAAISVFQNADDVGNVSGKCGQGLFNGLFVPNISVYTVEKVDLRTRMGRYMQAGLCHESQKSNGLKGHGLATSIWTRDYHGICLGVQFDINRHNRYWIQQRVACLV